MMHPKYRPDIDGLRAVAVLSVVAYHAFPTAFRGGFVGVDVFFVISGFLISTILFGSLSSGTFSFRDFYIRRIKRIFPALIFVLIACYAFGWFSLLSDEYQQLGKHIAGGAAFVSNFLFWRESGYFDNAADTKPLLHLWSLGIEEQFYIIWPLVLWATWQMRRYRIVPLVAIFAASFACSVRLSRTNGVAAFYSPQARFWELLVGAAFAYATLFESEALAHLKRQFSGNTRALIGTVLLTAGLTLISDQTPFPSYWALLPTLGAVLLISADQQAWINRNVLANRILVWVGIISYPLYLWHWPLLSFARIVESGAPSGLFRLTLVSLAFLLAWLTNRWVEKPLRFGQSSRAIAVVSAAVMTFAGLVGLVTYTRHGFPFRKSIQAYEQRAGDISEALLGPSRSSDGSCERELHLKTSGVCLVNARDPEMMIVGDSHAMALNSAAYQHWIRVKTLLIGGMGCPPFPSVDVYHPDGTIKLCRTEYADALEAAKNIPTLKTIIIQTVGPTYFTGERYHGGPNSGLRLKSDRPNDRGKDGQALFYEGYVDFVSKLISLKKKVVFVIDNPELGADVDVHGCIGTRPFQFKTSTVCSAPRESVLRRQSVYRSLVAAVKRANPELVVFDSVNSLCDESCSAVVGGHLLYFDDNHLSPAGSQLLLSDILKVI